jgi:sugar diacid utilization regulator/GAF domain-containing protein
VIVANAHTDPRIIKATVRFWSIRSMMAVPLLFDSEVIGVIYLDDIDRPHTFTQDDANLASMFGNLAAVAVKQADAKLELHSRLQAAGREIKALRRATLMHERLSDLVAGGHTLQELIEALAELLGKPCAVHDADHFQLAVARPPGAHDDIVPRLLEPPCVDAPDVRQALETHPNGQAFVVGPLPDSDVRRRHLVAPILVEGERWGHLVVVEHNTRFTGGDMLILRRAATLVALQMSSERKALEADWNAGASLAAELFAGSVDRSAVNRRAERLGVRLDAPHVVVLMAHRDGDAAPIRDFRAVAAAFGAVDPGLRVLATSAEGGVAVLLEVPDPTDDAAVPAMVKEIVQRVWEELGAGHPMVAGISSTRVDPDGYANAHTEAQQVVECIRRFGTPDGPAILSEADLGAGRIFLATCDAELVASFAEETFGELAGDPSKADLLITLCSFFENMASIRRCALRLGVHENTIRYRLGRIEELTKQAVTHNPDGQLGARLSLLVLMLQNRLPTSLNGHLAEPAQGEQDPGQAAAPR